jgi:hypothetical protein
MPDTGAIAQGGTGAGDNVSDTMEPIKQIKVGVAAMHHFLLQ